MSKKIILNEDLKPGDLEDLVSDQIEIDTFKPKINPKNIVVVFFVQEENPAYDLSNFIEFSSDDVLDTEVSPAPNENGYYLVFIEFTPVALAKKVYTMLKAVSYLVNNKEWSYVAYGKKGKITIK